MFVYEYMAGLYSEITGGNDAEFDPHKYRVISKPTTYADTMIHMLKGSIGAGILAMPQAMGALGILYGPVALVLLGIFATYCIHVLIRAQYTLCKRHSRGYLGYPKMMLFALRSGPKCLRPSARCFYYFVDVVLVIWQLGICCIYLVFVASNTKQLADFYGTHFSLRMHLCFFLGPTIVVNLVKDLKLMTPLSGISNVCMTIGIIIISFYLMEDDLVLTSSMMQMKGYIVIPEFIGTCLFAMEAVGVILALEYNMENPKQFVGLFGLFNIGMIIIVALYLVIGVFGYLKYGDRIEASITLNLPQNEKKAIAAKAIFTFAIFLSFPLQNFVAYSILWRRLSKRIEPERQLLPDYSLRVALVVVPWILAFCIPTLGPFISLFGALCLSLLAIVFPALIDMCVLHPDNYGVGRYKLTRDILIMVTGILCCVSGVYSSVIEIIYSF